MTTLLTIGLANAVASAVLAGLVVLLVVAFKPRPAVVHALWVLVLIKLVSPPLVQVPLAWLPTLAKQTREQRGTAPESRGHPQVEPDQRAGPDGATNTSVMLLADASPTESTRQPKLVVPLTTHALEPSTSADVRNAEAVAPPAADWPERATSFPTPPPSFADWVTSDAALRRLPLVLVAIWLSGSLFYVGVAVTRIARFQRHLRCASPAPRAIAEETARLAGQLGIRRAPEVVLLDARISPAIWPLGRSLRMVLPKSLVERLDLETLSPLIGHELVHVRRRDHWVRGLELLATVVYWWYPLAWWARARLRRAEEECCDSWVAGQWPQRARAYANGLLEVVGLLNDPAQSPRSIPAPASGLGDLRILERRVRLILTARQPPRLTRSGMCVVAPAAALFLPLVPGLARPGATEQVDTSAQPRAAALSPPAAPAEATKRGDGKLPLGCQPEYQSKSPNGCYVAYAGWYHPPGGERQHALYLVEFATGKVRQLLGTRGLKLAPAWSLDSRKLAIADAPGYGHRYPLVIIDVASGEVERTGVDGVGPAWSPDGRWIAVTTEIHQAGGWVGGVPADGRIGIWDTVTKQLTMLSPPGHNLRDAKTGNNAMIGAVRPVWSPDGRWIAYLQRVYIGQAGETTAGMSVWVVDRQGREVRKVLDKAVPFRWSEDSSSLIDEQTGTVVALHSASSVGKDQWPSPPKELLAAVAEAEAARQRAASFDPSPILRANQAWQNPTLDHLMSVAFLHCMRPIRLDERFAWRRDGVTCLEVVHREDQSAANEIGRLHVTTPDRYRFTQRPGTRYPNRTEKTQPEIDYDIRSHLMGTRATFTALDWGRTPQRFELRDVRRDPHNNQVILEVAPREPRDRYSLNAGAMFETTSWAYVHHLYYAWCELTIEAGTNRILREADYNADGSLQCEIQFSDWQEVAAGESVPRAVHLHFPRIGRREPGNFDVYYRFRWLPEGLWILQSGESRFGGQEPQLEEVVDVAVNLPLPDLDARVGRVREAWQRLEQRPEGEPRTALLRLHPFELGARNVLRWPAQSPGSVRELRFTIDAGDTRYREAPGPCDLQAVLTLAPTASHRAAEMRELLLVLYNAQGRPLTSTRIPLTALEVINRPAGPLLDLIRQHSRLWLAPQLDQLPDVGYTFHLGDKADPCSLKDPSGPHYGRGITLGLALDDLLAAPHDYRAPVVFDAELGERHVTVAVLVGPRFGHVFGNGLKGTWHHYTSTTDAQCLLVLDKETGRPLVSQHSGWEVHFLDYVEAMPGQFVPLRIVVLDREGGVDFDFRFQLVAGRVWLFDRSVSQIEKRRVFVDGVEMDGRARDDIRRSSAGDTSADVVPLDWRRVTARTIRQDGGNAFVRELVARVAPAGHPQYPLLEQLATNNGELTINLGRGYAVRESKYWTLTQITGGVTSQADRSADEPKSGNSPIPVAVVPFRTDEEMIVAQPSDSGTSEIRSLRFRRNDRGELLAEVELVSRDHWKELIAAIEVTLLDQANAPCGSAGATRTFHVEDSIYDARGITLDFGPVSLAQPRAVQVGLNTAVIGEMMGRTRMMFLADSPLFPPEVLLRSDDRAVWSYGLAALNRYLREQVLRGGSLLPEKGQPLGSPSALALRDYRDRLAVLLTRAGDVDDLVLLCRLAGYTQDARLIEPLAGLLSHEDQGVQDAAAIGLGLLGDARGRQRILAIIERPSADQGPSVGASSSCGTTPEMR